MRRLDEAIVAAARGLIGVPFRLHGRNRATGIDCVGLVVVALAGAGRDKARAAAPVRYRLRGGHVADHEARLRAAGLVPVEDELAGDVLLVEAAPAQFHLMIATGAGHVHADAGLRRVVEMPGASPWPVISRWRCDPFERRS